jgi:hypothetical protein
VSSKLREGYEEWAIRDRLCELAEEFWMPGSLPKCYVSGPMTGLPYFNFPSFEAAAELLRCSGWFVYSPRENDSAAGIEPDPEGKLSPDGPRFKDLMRKDLWQTCDSDALFVLPGWEYSAGAQIEVDVAHRVGVPVYSLLSGRKIEAAPYVPHEFSSRSVGYDGEASQNGGEGGPTPVDPPFVPALDFGPEWRAKDPVTGGSKGRKQAVFANMSLVADVYEARVHGFGVMKYPDEAGEPNWSRGMPWSWFYDALRRHIAAFWSGEDINPESGLPHLAHARWMISNLIEYLEYGIGSDDRPSWRKKAA